MKIRCRDCNGRGWGSGWSGDYNCETCPGKGYLGNDFMIKTTIELERRNHIKGYGTIYHNGQPWRPDGDDTLDVLTMWSAAHPDQKVYRHVVREVEERRDHLSYHYASEAGLSQEHCAALFKERMAKGLTGNTFVYCSAMVTRCPQCDQVYYLDIYHQPL